MKLLLALPLAVLAANVAPASPVPTVSCDSAAMFSSPPMPGSGERVLFDRVAVPQRLLPQVVRVSEGWPYWRKAGLLVRAGTRGVSVTVPPAWRDRVAIEWGDSGTVPSLRVAPCTRPPYRWNVYTGGFHLRAAACVPLIVRVGTRSATVRFGIGATCPAK
jgi:hypothetical protein